MDVEKIAKFIKKKRKELGLTQEELANKLFVTEKAVSRWETGRGTPDISLLVPLSKALGVDVSEILEGENKVLELIKYSENSNKNKFNKTLKLVIFFYVISLLIFLVYLRFQYDPSITLNYFYSLIAVVLSSILIVIGNKIYADTYVEKIEDKNKIFKISLIIIFIYYIILLFNVVIFARYNYLNTYNLIPLKTISNMLSNGSVYTIIINIFGNFIIFMPLEYFIIRLFKINKFGINLILSLFIMIISESLQYIFKLGVFDIDDILLCVLGMMFFYFIYNKYQKSSTKKNNMIE